jgi:UDP-N-acetylmuramoylalanine--D-glutamate ligase
MEDQHDIYVLEISSFQLDRCFNFKPDVAVLLNITPDHLDRYEYKFENYIASKFRMFQNADAKTPCIFWSDDEVIKSNLHKIPFAAALKRVSFHEPADAYISSDKIHFEGAEVILADAPLKGPHNAINMSVAMLAAHEAGVSYEQILASLPRRVLHALMARSQMSLELAECKSAIVMPGIRVLLQTQTAQLVTEERIKM